MQTRDCEHVKCGAELQTVRVVRFVRDLLVDQHNATHDVVRVSVSSSTHTKRFSPQLAALQGLHFNVPSSDAERRYGLFRQEAMRTAKVERQVHALRIASGSRRWQEQRQVVHVKAAERDLERIGRIVLRRLQRQLFILPPFKLAA